MKRTPSMIKRRSVLGSAVAAWGLSMAKPLRAQAYPARPIKLIVPYPPGGTTDLVARAFAEHMARELGQPFVVDNRPGAATNIGTEAAMRSPPDGYTLLLSTSGLATNFATGPVPAFDPQKTLAPITLINQMAFVVCANPSAPFSTVRELLSAARARPGRITIGSASLEYIVKLLNAQSGVDILHVPYKGGAAAMNDAISGQIDLAVALTPVMLPQIQSGRLKPIGVSAERRVGALPNVSTFIESGESTFRVDSWYALHGPAGMPPPIVRQLSDAAKRVLTQPEFVERQRAIGSELSWSTPEELAGRLKADTAEALRTARDLKLTPGT